MKSLIKKPMLAGKVEDISKLRFPLIASPKIDGIRCLIVDAKPVSRKFIDIPNKYIQKNLSKKKFEGLDGELTVGKNFQDCTSGVMSHDGKPDFIYWVFDRVVSDLQAPYVARLKNIELIKQLPSFVKIVPYTWVYAEEDLLAYEADCIDQGFEGVCVRDPHGEYKCGRSTFRQQWLLKLKRFTDSEAKILSVYEQETNTNTKTRDNLGNAKRSTAKAGKKKVGTLGGFNVVDLKSKQKFKVATGQGLTAAKRKELWKVKTTLVGKIIKYRYQDHGTKDKPRIPIMLGFRDERDMP